MQFEFELKNQAHILIMQHHSEFRIRNQAVIDKTPVGSLIRGVRARAAFRRGAGGASLRQL
jgi:hypothetical protein